ncbi:MAG: right-handed parallel beta-helix repeat-containing protein, partial [Verrucomicrobiota bacterium]
APIVFSSYAASGSAGEARATIDAKGFLAAVHLSNSRHIRIADLVVTADGGGWHSGQAQSDMRCGVLIDADAPGHYEDLQLTNLLVKEVSLNEPGFVRPKEDVNTANGTVGYGWGIRFMVTTASAQMRDISVLDSVIENVNHTGLKFTAPSNGIQQVNVERVRVLHSGGPGMQMSGVRGGHFSGLYVNGSGSTNDTRNWGRGSGLWTWTSSDIIIEKSQFLNANGPGDSAGVHIDYNCRNVVVQYNLSANNAGGFCEILGNNYNNAYRYNVSINDGSRVKGENGAMQEGKTFWLSGYTGNKSPRSGPYNSYFYNNTIYVSAEHVAKIAVSPTSEGVLIANNIFYLKGRSQLVKGDQSRPDDGRVTSLRNVVFENNLYLQAANWPKEVMIQDQAPIIGNPDFRNAGGLRLEDYAPQNASLVRNRGIRIPKIPNDTVGLTAGLDLDHDILGNKIFGRPDLGAVEVSPDASASLRGATARTK